MMVKAEITAFCLLLIGIAYCIPTGKSKHTAITCPSSFCESGKYECTPTPSCNGTSKEIKKLECQCCPLCSIAEGDRCMSDGLSDEDKEKPPTNSEQVIREGIIKAEEQINKGKQCKQGLVCLLGTCVTVY